MEYSASRIRDLRRELGITQRQFAELLGVTFVTISRWESNRVQPNRLALKAISALVQHNPRSAGKSTGSLDVPKFKAEFNSPLLKTHLSIARNETVQFSQEDHVDSCFMPVHDERTDILDKSKIFTVLNKEQRIQLSKIAGILQLKPQRFLFHEGDLLEYFYIVGEGRIKIFMNSRRGIDFIMGFSGPGRIFGNIALVSGIPHTSSAQAMTDVKVLAINNADFISFLSNRPDIGFKIFRQMFINFSNRLTNLMRRITDMAVETAEYRIAYILIRLFSDFGSDLPFTRQEIAQMAGTATETAIRILKCFETTGAIRSVHGKIVILNQTKLKEFLETEHR